MRLALGGALHTRTARPLEVAEPNSAASEMLLTSGVPDWDSLWYSCLSVKGRLRMSPTSLNFQKLHLRAAARCTQTFTGSKKSTVLEKQESGTAGQACCSEHRSTLSYHWLGISLSLMMWLSEPASPESPAEESCPWPHQIPIQLCRNGAMEGSRPPFHCLLLACWISFRNLLSLYQKKKKDKKIILFFLPNLKRKQ